MQCNIMLYKIQNHECSKELEHNNQDMRLLTTVDTYWFEETVYILLFPLAINSFNNQFKQMPQMFVICIYVFIVGTSTY